VRADLRRSVRRLLAKYGYPPDLAEGATQLVLRQAELSTETPRRWLVGDDRHDSVSAGIKSRAR